MFVFKGCLYTSIAALHVATQSTAEHLIWFPLLVAGIYLLLATCEFSHCRFVRRMFRGFRRSDNPVVTVLPLGAAASVTPIVPGSCQILVMAGWARGVVLDLEPV